MRALRLVFCALAGLGLFASLTAHLSTFFGVDPMEVFPPVMMLHLGIFVVCMPAFFLSTRVVPGRSGGGTRGQLLQDAPRWGVVVCTAFFIYAFVNFALFVFQVEGTAHQRPDGTYYLGKKSVIVRELTEEEFHQNQAVHVRGFSGHWMVFYSWSFAAILTRLLRPDPATTGRSPATGVLPNSPQPSPRTSPGTPKTAP